MYPKDKILKSVNIQSDFLTTLLYLSFIVFSNNSTGVFVMIGLIILILVINIIGGNTNLHIHFGRFHEYMLLFGLFSLTSALWAIKPHYAIEKGLTIFELLICFSVLYSLYYKASIERLVKIIMWAGFILSIYTIMFYGIQGLQSTVNDESRIENSFANVNVIGMVCCTSILICAYLSHYKISYIQILFCIPCLFVVAASGSRKASVILVLGLIYLFWPKQSHKKNRKSSFFKKIWMTLIIIILLYIIVQSNIFGGVMLRMDGLIASVTGVGDVDNSSMVRSYFRVIGFKQLLETPIFGIGMGNARILAYAGTGLDCYLHCNYAELAANGGIIGLVLFYWIYIPIIKTEKKYRKTDKYATLILILTVITLVNDYGTVSYYSKYYYFLIMVVILHINKLKQKKNNEKNLLPTS